MRVLIIDNNIDRDSWGAAEIARFGKLVPAATIMVRRGPHEDLPAGPAGFDKIILSGSKTSALDDAPWIDRLHEFVRRAVDCGNHLLGICYGHQTLVRALSSREHVRRAAEAEFGWTEIHTLEESALLKGLPARFYSFSSHFDEVAELPPGIKRLAKSAACETQACQIEGRPVFGIQFHPEKNLAESERTLAARKKIGEPKRLLEPDRGKDRYDAAVGETIFRNFFAL